MRRLAIVLTAALLLTGSLPAASAEPRPPTVAEIKAYAKRYVTEQGGKGQWECYAKIIYRESRWNHKAQNGKYYGLGQIANAKKRHANQPYKQVRAAWEYMVHRYDNRACGAWKHHQLKNWY